MQLSRESAAQLHTCPTKAITVPGVVHASAKAQANDTLFALVIINKCVHALTFQKCCE